MSSSPASAPIRVFISYSHDSQEHADRVLALADRLTQDGIEVALDQYENPPPADWRLWMQDKMEEANLVLIICSKNYFNRIRQKVKPGEGKGVKWEALLAYQAIYDNDSLNPKFIPVLLKGNSYSDIPEPLRGGNFYDLASENGYDELYWRITGQPAATRPTRGKVRKRPPRRRTESAVQKKRVERKLTELWNVPQEQNPAFTGREEILTQLRADLLKNRKQALSGLGGIGKTQIAVEYAHRYRDHYGAVLWTFADSEQSINTGFANIAKLLDLPEKDSAEQAVVVEAVKRWLGENDNWLLAFDNADSPLIVSKFLPQNPNGHVLLTSRAYTFQTLGILKSVEVLVLSQEAALEFLLKRTAREGTVESKDAQALAKELGYLPLALEQAAAYLFENGSSFRDYLASYKTQRLKLLEKQGPLLGSSQEQQKRTVATTWAINFADVEKSSPASADLLRLCAFLAPDAIPLELLDECGTEMSGRLTSLLATAKDDPLIIDELLKPLASYSLLRRNPETRSFSIHPLVQETVRDGMSLTEKKAWAEGAVMALARAFPYVQFENWSDCDRLLLHALVCALFIKIYKLEFETAVQLLNRAGRYLRQRARYEEAESLYQHSLAISERVLGAEHPDTATRFNDLAVLYRDQGRYAEAAPLFEKTLRIYEKALGSEHSWTATSLNNLAAVYRSQERYEEAEPLCQRSLAICDKLLGSEHPQTATSLNNLGSLYRDQKKYTEAEPMLRRSLAIREKVLGPEHPDTAITANNLAVLYHSQGNYAQAERLYRCALEVALKVLGQTHPTTVHFATNLNRCYSAQASSKKRTRQSNSRRRAVKN